MKSRGPLVAILALMAVLVFVGGVRYGGRVEKMNKKISFIISLTPPTQPPTPSPTPLSIEYKTFSHKSCSISFLYPAYLKVSKESSRSAELQNDGFPELAFSCEAQKPKFENFGEYRRATESAKLNPTTGRKIYFKLHPDLVPLLDSSIEYRVK